MTVIINLYWPI